MSTRTSVAAIAVHPDQPNSLQRTTVELPPLGESDVLVDVIRVGVCGTDREIIRGDLGFAPEGSELLVIGHEVLGRVNAVGDAVTDLAPGDLVTATVRRPDGCPACQAGDPDMCLWLGYTERGINGAHGFLMQQFVESRDHIIPVPVALEATGVLVEPLTVVEKAVRQAFLIQQRMAYWQPRTAIVTGAGPIGILGSMLLRSLGIDVYTVARTPAPHVPATALTAAGAHYVSTREESLRDLADRVGPVDLIIESSGSSHVVIDAMQILGNNGVLVLLSLTGGDHHVEVPTDAMNTSLVVGNKVVVGSVNAGAVDFTHAVERLAHFDELWPGLAASLITSRLSFDTPLEAITGKATDGIKTVIEVGG
jgi:threonine dehydrogenase-like Zn-dependent dehydrogenase